MTQAALPAATVVVPAFNTAATIEECVRSLLGLRYPVELREIVVVDNGSRDGTRAALERFADSIVLLDEQRRGASAARNTGIRHAHGEVIAFTDADCTVDPDWLRELVEPLGDSEVGIVGGAILARKGANTAELYGETIHDHRAAMLPWGPPYAITMNWASRRSVLEEVGPFDERLRRCEDVDLSYRIGRAGYSLVYRPAAITYHRNERSLLGLCREGWQHGFFAVPIRARHADYIAARRPSANQVPVLGRKLPARYGHAFRAGKRLGQAMGRAWLGLRGSRQPTGSPA